MGVSVRLRSEYVRWVVVARIAVALVLAAGLGYDLGTPQPAHAVPSEVYFPETGHHVSDPFLNTWRTQGGLSIFGYPLSEAIEDDGRIVQYFERSRFEYHPEFSGTPHEVLLTLLGNELVRGRTWETPFQRLERGESQPGRNYYPETGHYLVYGFKEYWESHGGLAIFGFPISEEFTENGRTVQYFERARFEWWPEHQGTPYEVLLGHLGADAAERDQVDRAPVPRKEGIPNYDPGQFVTSLRLPVLMYHRVSPYAERYAIPLWRFEQQLDWLQSNGYTTVTVGQVYDFMYGAGTLPAKPIVITFDDGDRSQWDASLALDKRGMKGVFFITTGQTRLDDWQLRSMADRGHEIGSHTITHPSLPNLSSASLYHELVESRRVLEQATGRPVEYLAYPFGEYDGRVIAATREAGYRGAVAAWGGQGWDPGKRWEQPRIEISGLIGLDEFSRLVK